MIVRESTAQELESIAKIEQQAQASAFISQMTFDEHQSNFEKEEIFYLSIVDINDAIVGYFILATEPGRASVEFRRIVIDRNHRGIGQEAIRKMEEFCISNLNRSRIWLNVYSDNEVGIHIYTKLGYQFD